MKRSSNKNDNKPTFIVQYPIKVTKAQQDKLDTDFFVCSLIYNNLVKDITNKIKEIKKTKKYRGLIKSLIPKDEIKTAEDRAYNSRIWDEIQNLYSDAGVTKYGLEKAVKKYQHFYKKNINSAVAQKLSNRVWLAVESFLYKNGKKIHYIKCNDFKSIESKSNSSGIIVNNENLNYFNITMPILLNRTTYEREAHTHRIKYNRIVRIYGKRGWKYYIQIVYEGYPPEKRVYAKLEDNACGIDPGMSVMSLSYNNAQDTVVLCPKAERIYKKIQKIQRHISNSERIYNPDNFNSDGTIKKGKRIWKRSKTCKALKRRYRYLANKMVRVKKYEFTCVINKITQQASLIKVEKMNYRGLQKKAKKKNDTLNKTKNIKRRKRFGLSILKYSPSTFLKMLETKIKSIQGLYLEVDTFNLKASQYDHVKDTYEKISLSQRSKEINGIKVPRDAYSSYLIRHVNPDLKTYDKNKLKEDFDDFVKYTYEMLDRLVEDEKNTGIKYPSCIGLSDFAV